MSVTGHAKRIIAHCLYVPAVHLNYAGKQASIIVALPSGTACPPH